MSLMRSMSSSSLLCIGVSGLMGDGCGCAGVPIKCPTRLITPSSSCTKLPTHIHFTIPNVTCNHFPHPLFFYIFNRSSLFLVSKFYRHSYFSQPLITFSLSFPFRCNLIHLQPHPVTCVQQVSPSCTLPQRVIPSLPTTISSSSPKRRLPSSFASLPYPFPRFSSICSPPGSLCSSILRGSNVSRIILKERCDKLECH